MEVILYNTIYQPRYKTYHSSFDNTINNQGKWLLELCKSLNMRILNGGLMVTVLDNQPLINVRVLVLLIMLL